MAMNAFKCPNEIFWLLFFFYLIKMKSIELPFMCAWIAWSGMKKAVENRIGYESKRVEKQLNKNKTDKIGRKMQDSTKQILDAMQAIRVDKFSFAWATGNESSDKFMSLYFLTIFRYTFKWCDTFYNRNFLRNWEILWSCAKHMRPLILQSVWDIWRC